MPSRSPRGAATPAVKQAGTVRADREDEVGRDGGAGREVVAARLAPGRASDADDGVARSYWRGTTSPVGLVYERLGTGPPLVLLHGLGHRRQAWYAVVSRLAPRRDLILVDLPGHGESPPLDTNGRSVRQALIGDLFDLLDKLGLDHPHLAGNSLGGWLALEAAAGGRAASVTAFSPAGFWRTSRQFSYTRAVLRTMQILGRVARPFGPALSRQTAGRALIYAVIVSRPSRVSPVQAAGDMAAFLAARKAADSILSAATSFTDFVPANVPVTIAWGTRDRLLSPRQALVARERLPAARLVTLPGCGHVPMTDDPHLVADILLRGSRAESGLLERH